MMKKSRDLFDVVIVGGSYLGLSAAISLSKKGFDVAIINNKAFNEVFPYKPSRLFAISRGTIEIFKDIGIKGDIESLGQKINHIEVNDGDSPLSLNFNPSSVNLHDFGYMIEEHLLHNLLNKEMLADKKITKFENVTTTEIKFEDVYNILVTDKGEIGAKIIIAADGKSSTIRDLAAIEVSDKDYNQIALVIDIEHKEDHKGIAIEKFLPNGPFAVLPKKGGFESSIVWTIDSKMKKSIQNINDDLLEEMVKERFDNVFGDVKIIGKPSIFPLTLRYAKEYSRDRVYLVGDALHALHPLAGQGLNLCMRDLEVLVNSISEAHNLGLDIGKNSIIAKYRSKRVVDNMIMTFSTDSLNFLFSNNFKIVKTARRLGLGLVDKIPFLKNTFMRYASGVRK